MDLEDHAKKLQDIVTILDLNSNYLVQYIKTLITRIQLLERENICEFHQQSSEVIVEGSGTGDDHKQETVTFHETNQGEETGQDSSITAFLMGDAITDASLANFLRRPVRVASATWLEADNVGTTIIQIPVWNYFFNDDRVKYKLNNFGYLRANLKVKILLNSSPFYYGAALATYQPLHALTPSTIVNNVGNHQFIPYSQRPHAWLLPQKNEGAVMTLPFLYHKNWLTINSAQEFSDMGLLTILNYTLLRSANNVGGTGVTIQVYAWAEDVVLSANTTSLSMQSKEYVADEYGTGIISGPSTFISNVAGKLKTLPVIGKWATATQIGANAVTGIAKLFGFTNVPVIDDACAMRIITMPQLASTEIGYPTEKLTLDSKNELSVDPSILGLNNDDELSMSYLLTRDSYLTSFDWVTTDAVDAQLFQCRVNPYQFATLGDGVNDLVYYTPPAYVANMFENWRGDLIYRFDFMASPFHKGRVRISYDPRGTAALNITNTNNVSNVVYTEIIDLSVHTSHEMRIPYQQATPYLKIPYSNSVTNVPYRITPAFTALNGQDNGMFNIRVVNTLTAPVITAPITVLVSVRGADNLELANPTNVTTTTNMFQTQSKETVVAPTTTSNIEGGSADLDNMRGLLNFGESVRSLRPLLRRLNFSHAVSIPGTGLTGHSALNYYFHKIPPYPGFDPAGMYTATKVLGVGTAPYNYTRTIPLQWMLPCYVGYRGSVQWHFNPNFGASSINHFSASRIPWNPVPNSFVMNTQPSSAVSKSISSFSVFTQIEDTNAGAAMTNTDIQTGLSVQVPNYSNYLFQTTNPLYATNPPNSGNYMDGSALDVYRVKLMGVVSRFPASANGNTAIEVYVGAGTDFMPVFFLNTPVTYKTGAGLPPPV